MTMRAEVAWPRPTDLTDEQLGELGAGLPGYPVAIDAGYYLYLRFDVEAVDLDAAFGQAMTLASEAHVRAFGADADPVQLAISPAEVGLIPAPMDLVGTTDVGQILGVSRQRAGQLADRLPAPVGYPSGAPAWARRAVEITVARWGRTGKRDTA